MYRQQNCVCVCWEGGFSPSCCSCHTSHIVATGFRLHHWFDVSTINCFDKRNVLIIWTFPVLRRELLHVEVYD